MFDQKSKGNQLHIRHALNGGEMKNYRADGYAEQIYVSRKTGKSEKKTIIFYMNGCFLACMSHLLSKPKTSDKSA